LSNICSTLILITENNTQKTQIMKTVKKNCLFKIKSFTASLLVILFCGGLMLSPNLARAEGDGDGDRTWRKGHCFLDKNEEICRRKKEGDTCPGANYCDGSTYLDAAAKVATVVKVIL
jgi:hypothetical protein